MSSGHGRARVLRDLGLGDEDLAAWHAATLPEERFEAWLVDRVARRPSGARARKRVRRRRRARLRARAILEALALGTDDRLLEVGCGGGLLLRDALATGARVTGIDHSDEMVALARDRTPALR